MVVLTWAQVLKQNLFSVFLAADDGEESEISFGECPDDISWLLGLEKSPLVGGTSENEWLPISSGSPCHIRATGRPRPASE